MRSDFSLNTRNRVASSSGSVCMYVSHTAEYVYVCMYIY